MLRRLTARLRRGPDTPVLAASLGSPEPWDLLEARQQVDVLLVDEAWRVPPPAVPQRRFG